MYIEKVKQFHEEFLQVNQPKPYINKEVAKLRISLIKEELKELEDAIDNSDVVEVLDALCDLQYVLSGSVLQLGFKDIFNEAFTRVHESNMSKLCKTEDVKEASDKLITDLKAIRVTAIPTPGGLNVLLNENGKIVKPFTYKPVDLKPLLEL